MSSDTQPVICFHCGSSEGAEQVAWPTCSACRARRLDAVPAPFGRTAPIYQGDFRRYADKSPVAPSGAGVPLGTDPNPDQPA